ncbi:phosphotransferase [Clostridium sp. D33t1_170424_F3]|uniref:phosphotransferase n=1 Tax=Clostridium sp. D33t1_170424_F3 TaxID=2787099 RepID=UPI0018AA7359|nr:phosphotransferase [Clostridium sp. D33t1_170424_F3]
MTTWDRFKQELKILGIEEAEHASAYLVLPSQENARWAFPLISNKAFKVGLMLYSPSTQKGKLYKKYLQIVPIWLLKKIERKHLAYLQWKESPFIGKDQCPAFFMGNGGPHSKVTVQVQNSSGPCSYLKYTYSPVIASLFQNESAALKELEEKAPSLRVPHVINQSKRGNASVFQTSSVKSLCGETVFDFTELHVRFLVHLCFATKSASLSSNGQFYVGTKKMLKQFPGEEKERINALFEQCIATLLPENLPVSRIHGDFTPWNTVVEKGVLSCFDWEYSRRECLPVFDAIHFLLQPDMLNSQKPLKQIWTVIRQDVQLLSYFKQIGYPARFIREYVMLYLIDILLFYHLRTEEHSGQEQQLINRWKALLHLLEEREKA